jgi:transposase InsO family protein
VNHKRVERIWRKEGLEVPRKQPKRRRLWLNDGSCIRLRPDHKDHVWSYDLMIARTADGRAFRILNIIDEYTRECLAILVKRHITSQEVIDLLFELFTFRGIPEHIRSDNGPEFTAKAVRKWLEHLAVRILFIERESP